MPRSAPLVRPAAESDLPAMVALGEELREALLPSAEGSGRPGTPSARAALLLRLTEALHSADRHLVVAVDDDGETLGMALFTETSANSLFEAPALHMSHAVVADRHKRRGAGRALVAAAAARAEERGLDQLVVSARPGCREANRFFSRLGFAPLAVRRSAPVSLVARRLSQAEHGVATPLTRRRPRPPRRAGRRAVRAGPVGLSRHS